MRITILILLLSLVIISGLSGGCIGKKKDSNIKDNSTATIVTTDVTPVPVPIEKIKIPKGTNAVQLLPISITGFKISDKEILGKSKFSDADSIAYIILEPNLDNPDKDIIKFIYIAIHNFSDRDSLNKYDIESIKIEDYPENIRKRISQSMSGRIDVWDNDNYLFEVRSFSNQKLDDMSSKRLDSIMENIVKNVMSITPNTSQDITNKSFKWEFGCEEYCDGSGPSKYIHSFTTTNTGSEYIEDLTLIIEFYRASGKLYNNGKSDTKAIGNPGNTTVLYIDIPFRYSNEETWSYAELYLLYKGRRYHFYTWREDSQGDMPVIDGTFVFSNKQK